MFDYEFLRLTWWLLLGALLIGFAITDGFDLGVASLLRLLGRDDAERRSVLEAVEPVWEGNQVWFILAGGAIFAAWPLLYAASFSGLYFAMFAVLVSLILRPVGFAFRGKLQSRGWRNSWDWLLTLSGILPSYLLGVAFGNLFLGLPFDIDSIGRFYFAGSFWQLLHPFALFCGLVSLSMFAMHGASYAAIKVSSPVRQRAQGAGIIAATVLFICLLLGGYWVDVLPGHMIVDAVNTAAPSNPLNKVVATDIGAWLSNYKAEPRLKAVPLAAVALSVATALFLFANALKAAFITSGLTVSAVISTGGVALFPFFLPSSLNPNAGLTVWDASSSQHTLELMLFATVTLLPVVLLYTAWVYRTMRGQVSVERIRKHFGWY